MKKLATKIYNGFSRTNINTDNSISLGFLIISCALLINSILSLATIVEGVTPLIACLCGLVYLVLSYLTSWLACTLFKDYKKSVKEVDK